MPADLDSVGARVRPRSALIESCSARAVVPRKRRRARFLPTGAALVDVDAALDAAESMSTASRRPRRVEESGRQAAAIGRRCTAPERDVPGSRSIVTRELPLPRRSNRRAVAPLPGRSRQGLEGGRALRRLGRAIAAHRRQRLVSLPVGGL